MKMKIINNEEITSATIESIIQITNESVKMLSFSWTDYILFVLILVLSVCIGIYFGFFKHQNTSDKYLLGGKQMHFLPVAISLVASHISGITLLGVPSDVYYYGTAYMASTFSAIIVGIATYYIYLPVFHNLQISNSFKYLEMRFDNRIRYIASFLFILKTVFYIPIVIYVPALAFSQVTGFNIHYITPLICFVCIFYTTIGGLKAVVWTDTLQFIITVITLSTVFIVGVIYCGGMTNILNKSEQGGRLDLFNLDPSLTSRCTFWGVLIGLTTTWFADLGVNQGCIQKFLSIPKYTDIKKSMIVFVLGIIGTKMFSALMGLVMYTKYQHCDPFTTKSIKRHDQILPYFIMDISGHISGLPGLFIAGVFCTALSTMSASLNTMSGTMYQDFIVPFLHKRTDEKRASNIMKCCAFITGIICVTLVLIVERLGGILQIGIAAASVTSGPILGLFTLGMCFPWANTTGALVGSISSLTTILLIFFGAQYHIAHENIKYPKLPLSTLNCNNSQFNLNYTYPIQFDRTAHINNEVWFPFKLSYMYYSLLSVIIVIVVGMVVSWLTGFQNYQQLNAELISPIMQFAVPSKITDAAMIRKEKHKVNNETIQMIHQQ